MRENTHIIGVTYTTKQGKAKNDKMYKIYYIFLIIHTLEDRTKKNYERIVLVLEREHLEQQTPK